MSIYLRVMSQPRQSPNQTFALGYVKLVQRLEMQPPPQKGVCAENLLFRFGVFSRMESAPSVFPLRFLSELETTLTIKLLTHNSKCLLAKTLQPLHLSFQRSYSKKLLFPRWMQIVVIFHHDKKHVRAQIQSTEHMLTINPYISQLLPQAFEPGPNWLPWASASLTWHLKGTAWVRAGR